MSTENQKYTNSPFKWGKTDWTPIHYFEKGEADGSAKDVALLGGKGAHLAEMCNLGLPVPMGFTIDTDVSTRYNYRDTITVRYLGFRVLKAYAAMSKKLGHAPLVSVRSGAPVSMPGMMDTISNVGLTSENMAFWKKELGSRTAYDCRRRFIVEFGTIVKGIPADRFKTATLHPPHGMTAKELEDLCLVYETVYAQHVGNPFPDDVQDQLIEAIEAVLCSWNNPRAIAYRNIENIDHSMGTAVNVQQMVFGNAGKGSGTGVLFTRNPATGANEIHGDFLQNAQGEDVVAGIVTPMELAEMQKKGFTENFAELISIASVLEAHYGDMQDVEFTIQNGETYILQTRTGKRSPVAAFRIASEQVETGSWTKEQALSKVSADDYAWMQRDIVDPAFTVEPNGKGINASPGFASGPAVFNNEQALASPVPGILVTLDTEADDLPGMNASAGVLTSTGGATCHAAVNSLSFKTPCVVGLGKVGEWIGSEIKEGTIVTIDGSTGRVWIGTEVPTVSGVDDPYVADLVKWGYEKTGAIYQSARVERPEQRVMVTEWLSDEGAKADSLDALANMKEDERSKVVLDVRGTLSFRREEDVSLWECFGDEPDKGDDAEVVAVIDLLEAHGFKGAVVSLEGALKEHAVRLEAAGYKVGREVETLADLLHSTGPVEVPKSFIENVVGGPAVYAELIDTFKAAGKEVTPMPVSMSTEQVVAETFGS